MAIGSGTMSGVPLPRFEPMLATRRPQLALDGAWVVGWELNGWRAVVMDDDGLMARTRSGREGTGSLLELAGLADVLPAGQGRGTGTR